MNTNKINKINNYIKNGEVVFEITIKADENPNYQQAYKWVLNDRWCRDSVGVEIKNGNGSVNVFLFNSFDLEHRFHGVDGIRRDMTNIFKNDARIGMKFI